MRAAVIAAVIFCAGFALARGPLIDYQCAARCVKKDGYAPVCVADGRDVDQGTIYPNNCVYNKCVTNGGNESKTPRYNYLPLDCHSAVACSLMGKDYEACLKTWADSAKEGYTGPSPKTDPMCECAKTRDACEDGTDNCRRCTADHTKCKTCDAGYKVNSAGKCKKARVKACRNNMDHCHRCNGSRCGSCNPGFRITSGGKCEECLVTGCAACQQSKHKCQRCFGKYQLKNEACYYK